MLFGRSGFIFASLCVGFRVWAGEPVTVTFLQGFDPDRPENPGTRQILRFAQREPRLNPQKWGGLSLPGDVSERVPADTTTGGNGSAAGGVRAATTCSCAAVCARSFRSYSAFLSGFSRHTLAAANSFRIR